MASPPVLLRQYPRLGRDNNRGFELQRAPSGHQKMFALMALLVADNSSITVKDICCACARYVDK